MTSSDTNSLGAPGHQTTSSTVALKTVPLKTVALETVALEADLRKKPSQIFFLAAILAALTAYVLSGLATT